MCLFCLPFQIGIIFLFSVGFIPIKGGGKDQLNTQQNIQQAKENLRVKFSLLLFSSYSKFSLPPKGKFLSFKNLSHKVLWSYLWCGSLLEVFFFGHCWFTTTECQGQMNKTRTKFQNQSKLLELSLNFWKQSMVWSDECKFFLKLFRLVYDAWTLGKPNRLSLDLRSSR